MSMPGSCGPTATRSAWSGCRHPTDEAKRPGCKQCDKADSLRLNSTVAAYTEEYVYLLVPLSFPSKHRRLSWRWIAERNGAAIDGVGRVHQEGAPRSAVRLTSDCLHCWRRSKWKCVKCPAGVRATPTTPPAKACHHRRPPARLRRRRRVRHVRRWKARAWPRNEAARCRCRWCWRQGSSRRSSIPY